MRSEDEQAEGPARDADSFADSFIISTDCMRCGVCEFMCPLDAIVEAKNQLIILKNVCDGCAKCVPYCLVHAIVPRDEFRDRQSGTYAARLQRALDKADEPSDEGEALASG